MIKLTLTEKNGEPRLLTFDKDEITIGRVSGNDIVLAKGNVSKRHSRFTVKSPGQIEVADLKSTNGTYVNGRKIGSPMLLSASDRVYVGDFLINIDLGGGAVQSNFAADFPGDSPAAGGGSAGHRLPIPPPPPPPRGRVGSSSAQLPTYDDSDGEGDAGFGGGDDEELGLAARPPGSGRVPIPPPPPPRRPPTPLASRGLGESDFDDGLGSAAPTTTDEPAEDTGSVGLFANSRSPDDESSRRPAAARPGAPAAPAAVPSFGSASVAPPMTTDVGGNAAGFEALLADAAVTQILITAPDAALVDWGAGLALHEGSLGEPNAVADALWRLANTAFPPPAPDNPVVDVRLADGTRVSAAFPPASPTGVVAAIRRPVLLARTLSDLDPGREQGRADAARERGGGAAQLAAHR